MNVNACNGTNTKNIYSNAQMRNHSLFVLYNLYKDSNS